MQYKNIHTTTKHAYRIGYTNELLSVEYLYDYHYPWKPLWQKGDGKEKLKEVLIPMLHRVNVGTGKDSEEYLYIQTIMEKLNAI